MKEVHAVGISLLNCVVALGESGAALLLARGNLDLGHVASWDAYDGGVVTLLVIMFSFLNLLVFARFVQRRAPSRAPPATTEEPTSRRPLDANTAAPSTDPTPGRSWTPPPIRPAATTPDPLAWAYRELDIPSSASARTIRTAFRRAALRVHPDRNRDPEAAERFRALKSAYDALKE
jgi:hypothetical protein